MHRSGQPRAHAAFEQDSHASYQDSQYDHPGIGFEGDYDQQHAHAAQGNGGEAKGAGKGKGQQTVFSGKCPSCVDPKCKDNSHCLHSGSGKHCSHCNSELHDEHACFKKHRDKGLRTRNAKGKSKGKGKGKPHAHVAECEDFPSPPPGEEAGHGD